MNKHDKRPNKSPLAIPWPTLRRLPLYYQYLKEKLDANAGYVSCTDIANDLNLIPIQVRKDLQLTGASGKPKLGYEVKEVIEKIEEFLGYNSKNTGFIIGAGHLGTALLGYNGFSEYGLEIIAAFDCDNKKIGKTVNGKKILDIVKFETLVKRMGVKIGILTVPAEQAQNAADLMVRSGIRAIWNFSHVSIDVPEDVIVQHENLASSLAVLSKKLLISGKK